MVDLIGIPMPGDFPDALFDSVYTRVDVKLAVDPDAQFEFHTASNTVQYRFLECAEHDEAFTKVMALGAAAGGRDRFAQERELFGFFYSARSILEALAYALFAMGAPKWPAHFPRDILDHKKNFNIYETIKAYAAAMPTETFSQDVRNVFDGMECEQLRCIRNELTHRGQGSRLFFVGGPQSGNIIWRLKYQSLFLDQNTTQNMRAGLTRALSDIMQMTDTMTAREFR